MASICLPRLIRMFGSILSIFNNSSRSLSDLHPIIKSWEKTSSGPMTLKSAVLFIASIAVEYSLNDSPVS